MTAPILRPERICPECNELTLTRRDIEHPITIEMFQECRCICGYTNVIPLLSAGVMLVIRDDSQAKYQCDLMDTQCGLVRVTSMKSGDTFYYQEDTANDFFWPEGFSIRAQVAIDKENGLHYGYGAKPNQRIAMPSGVPDGAMWWVYLQMLAQVAQVAILQSGIETDAEEG